MDTTPSAAQSNPKAPAKKRYYIVSGKNQTRIWVNTELSVGA